MEEAGEKNCRVPQLRLDVVPAVAVLQQQTGSIEDQGLHRNFLFRGQFFQLPAQLGRDVHLNVHALNGIAAADPVRTGDLPAPDAGVFGRTLRPGRRHGLRGPTDNARGRAVVVIDHH